MKNKLINKNKIIKPYNKNMQIINKKKKNKFNNLIVT